MSQQDGGDFKAVYNMAAPDSLPSRLATYQRRRMFDAFQRHAVIGPTDTLLDVGVTSDQSHSNSNYLEAWFPDKSRITASGIDDASFLETLYPGLTFVLADGRDLPFPDGSFDHVHSNAVIEHVGNRANQAKFLSELWRVSRRSLFVTTPNRWFPVEVHTVRDFFAHEENLNLMSTRNLLAAAREAGIPGARVDAMKLGGWPANLLLCARRN
jgi:hypothetical protein